MFKKLLKPIPITLVLITFCLIAINIIMEPQPYNDFHPLEIKLTNYPETAVLEQNYSFNLLINDSRNNQEYVTSVYLNNEKQYTLNLKKGSNELPINFTKSGLQKVMIKMYNPNNEYNGYGYESNPFTLSFMVKVK